MLQDASAPADPGAVKENDAPKEAPLQKHTDKGMSAVQGLADDKASADPASALPQTGHLVPATVIEQIDRTRDVRKAEAIAAGEGISILDDAGKKHTVWYKTQPPTAASQ